MTHRALARHKTVEITMVILFLDSKRILLIFWQRSNQHCFSLSLSDCIPSVYKFLFLTHMSVFFFVFYYPITVYFIFYIRSAVCQRSTVLFLFLMLILWSRSRFLCFVFEILIKLSNDSVVLLRKKNLKLNIARSVKILAKNCSWFCLGKFNGTC